MTTWPSKSYCVFRLELIGGLYLHRVDALRTLTSPFNKNNNKMAAYWWMWQYGPRNSYYVLRWGLPIWGTRISSMRLALLAKPDYCDIRRKAYLWPHVPGNHIVYSDWDWLGDLICIALMHCALKPWHLTNITNMAAYWGMWQYGPRNSYYVLGYGLPIWGTWHRCVSPSRSSPTIATYGRKLVYDNMTQKIILCIRIGIDCGTLLASRWCMADSNLDL